MEGDDPEVGKLFLFAPIEFKVFSSFLNYTTFVKSYKPYFSD